jgi:hypothetical protein
MKKTLIAEKASLIEDAKVSNEEARVLRVEVSSQPSRLVNYRPSASSLTDMIIARWFSGRRRITRSGPAGCISSTRRLSSRTRLRI